MLNNKCQSFSRFIRDWLASHKIFRYSPRDSPIASSSKSFHDSPSHEMPRNSFLKSFSWETCFKPFPSSSKPLFQYFYIKTQSIWMIFHSINISKVTLNSFLWFWFLDYVLESFCALGWDFHHRGWGNLIFVKFLYGIGFFWWFTLDVGTLWQK